MFFGCGECFCFGCAVRLATFLTKGYNLGYNLGYNFFLAKRFYRSYICENDKPDMRKRELLKIRDKRMVQKFHELYDIKRMRIDDVLKELEEEWFFLDSNYIYSRIFYDEENNAYYQQLLGKNAKS